MAQTPQQPTTDQLQDLVDQAAATIIGGGALDDMARFQAAGCVVKIAADNNDTELLDLVALIGAGKYAQAAATLLNIAVSDGGGSQSGPAFDPLAGILSTPVAPAAAVPDPTTVMPKAPAAEPQTTDPAGTSDPGNQGGGGRRRRRNAQS
jgi:hypothetical protein